MKTIIKIILSLVLVTAMFNAGAAAFNNYSFEDAVHNGLLFDPTASDTEIVEMVMKLARPSVMLGLFLVMFSMRCEIFVKAGVWHPEQDESSAAGPPRWPEVAMTEPTAVAAALSASVEPVPVSHLMPSWQAPQEVRLGIFRWLSAVAAIWLSWQVVHMRWPPPSLEKPLLFIARPA